MSIDSAIRAALDHAGWKVEIVNRRSLSGGCIHTVEQVELSDGTCCVAKINATHNAPLFEEEAIGLRALAETNAVLVPQPIATIVHRGTAVMLMTAIQPGPGSASAWKRLGEELAQLHSQDVGCRYGFQIDNHLGTTPQPNTWCDDWIEFNARHRLGHQLALAKERQLLNPREVSSVEAVIERLHRLIPSRPRPALLHGDLWAGNALPATETLGSGANVERIALIDPACSIGDGWADIAMMKLFGGFHPACFEAYEANIDDHENIATRLAVYQLYHVLNHLNLFGRGYAGQTMMLSHQLQ